jgi:undecaprenyl-phosphate 4-deoxy-4-formamido-L-arabinose transferase
VNTSPSVSGREHLISVVIPVYAGADHLADVVEELAAYTETATSPGGHEHRVTEVLLVHDGGPDGSPGVMRDLARKHPFVRPLWLSRNFGQHAATLAGIASSGGEWVVTMDEDGQHDPAAMARMLDVAIAQQAGVVYAQPVGNHPHSWFRNLTSRSSKRVINLFSGGTDASLFHSYRLVLGEVARSIAAYSGSGVYLDIALGWVVGRAATTPVAMRDEGARTSTYSVRRLMSHFLRMVLTAGTRGLRMVSFLGIMLAGLGLVIAGYIVVHQIVDPAPVQGWSSMMVVVLLSTGALLFSMGVVSEYIGVAVNSALGKPLYLLTQDPLEGPLGRDRQE